MKKLTEDWLRAAQDDLDVIEKILNEESLSHIVAFHAQQCVEKSFKAIIEEYEIASQKIHNLVTLHGQVEDIIGEIDLRTLKTLDSLYIEARYPGELGLLPNGRPSQADAVTLADFSEETHALISRTLRGKS